MDADNLMLLLKNAAEEMQGSKKELENFFVDESVENGMIKVKMNGNCEIQNLSISQELINEGDKEAIEDLVILAFNRAVEKANKLKDKYFADKAGSVLGAGGLF